MSKPSIKFLVVMNVVANLPMAIAMSVSAPLLSGQPIVMGNLLINVLIGFILACLINILLPIQKISKGFLALFKLKPEGFAGNLVGNIPACLLFVLIIGLVLTYYNVREIPAFLFAFIGTFLPLYIICFIVSMIFIPLALKAAAAADK